MSSHDLKSISRREFVDTGAKAALLAALPWGKFDGIGSVAPKKILLLGGTGFIGPHLVKMAIEHGHTVSIFTRGRRDADLPESVERLVGDRNGKLDALVGRRWDVVIDDSATNPDWVQQSTALLKDSGRYLFTSSTGVYYPYLTRGVTEADPVRTEATDPKDGSESFGTRKAKCEAIVLNAFGTRGVVVRPTYIVGPGDYTDRFTYWPVRLTKGGEILAPGNKNDPVQFIDVRDLAAFMLKLVEDDASGIFNAIGPRETTSIDRFLRDASAALKVKPQFVWINDYAFLAKAGIDGMVPWILTQGNDLAHTAIKTTRSFAAGLRHRSTAETVRDTLAWFNTLPTERQSTAKWVISLDKEKELLAAWRTR